MATDTKPDMKSEDIKTPLAPNNVDQTSKMEPKADIKIKSAPVKPTNVTGRDIITDYRRGDPVGVVTYRKICNALEVLPKWEATAKIQFLEQFMDMSDLLDDKCGTLVRNLTGIPWNCIPLEIVERYKNLLCEIAIRQVTHTELIYQTAARNLLPVMQKSDSDEEDCIPVARMFSTEEEDRLFTLAHQIIAHVFRCFPMSWKQLLTSLQKAFPHYTQPSDVFIGYIRNIIQVAEYIPKIASELWILVVDNMVTCDTLLSRKDSAEDNSISGIFVMDDVESVDSEDRSMLEKTRKLDGSMRDVFTYLSLKHGFLNENDCGWLRLGDALAAEDVFQVLMGILENRLLMSVHVRYTSFIWLHLASLHESYPGRLLDFLWSVVTRPQRAQSDAKKAHGAAAYLAAFLARARFIRIDDAFTWMSRFVEWCNQYVVHCSSAQLVPGISRHGTFYSLCQAFFIAFSFRYKELVKTGDISEVSRWGIGRIVHSQLEPLKYVSRPVGLCFAAISRSLQLVYCNHVLPLDQSAQKPFEAMFPLDSYRLKESESFVAPLMRRFSPLAEDVSLLSSALQWGGANRSGTEEANDMGFLDEDDSIIGTPSRIPGSMIQCGTQSSLFTVYSTSPGLRHYDAVNMR